jgi:hypothetical protein
MAFADKLTVTTSNCLLLKNMFSPNDPEVHSYVIPCVCSFFFPLFFF